MGGFFLFNNVLFWPSAYPFQLPITVNFLTSQCGPQNSSPARGEVAFRPEEGEPSWGEFTYAPAALAAPPLA